MNSSAHTDPSGAATGPFVPYLPLRASRSEWISVRGLSQHLRWWSQGDDADRARPATPIVMLHGWMDCSATFQFVVDALSSETPVCAPDWRGFGLSDRTPSDSYWFPDYLADLDQLLERISPDAPVDLVAHSMGGNVALLYAGIRPERIRRIVNLEGLGLGATRSSQAPGRYRQWLDELREEPPRAARGYPTLDALAQRLMQSNRRLTPERARFIAHHWSRQRADGQFEILGDPAHKRVNPVLYRVPEVLACWRKIRASVLWVMAAEQPANRWHADDTAVQRRIRAIRSLSRVTVEDSGHMLHHDQPAVIARMIEDFFR